MATALAQTPVFDLSSPACVIEEENTGSAAAPHPWPDLGPTNVGPTAARGFCVRPDAGLAAGTAPPPCSEPGGEGVRLRPQLLTPTGHRYPGRLLDDILEYRALRAHMLAGNRLDTSAHARYVELEDLLRANEGDTEGRQHLRAFHRFDVQMQARLRHRAGRQTLLAPARVENISAGGVKLIMSVSPTLGEQVWLQLPLAAGSAAILPARVVWGSGHAVGLMFAGAPRWR
jgi:hypothetical protein